MTEETEKKKRQKRTVKVPQPIEEPKEENKTQAEDPDPGLRRRYPNWSR